MKFRLRNSKTDHLPQQLIHYCCCAFLTVQVVVAVPPPPQPVPHPSCNCHQTQVMLMFLSDGWDGKCAEHQSETEGRIFVTMQRPAHSVRELLYLETLCRAPTRRWGGSNESWIHSAEPVAPTSVGPWCCAVNRLPRIVLIVFNLCCWVKPTCSFPKNILQYPELCGVTEIWKSPRQEESCTVKGVWGATWSRLCAHVPDLYELYVHTESVHLTATTRSWSLHLCGKIEPSVLNTRCSSSS